MHVFQRERERETEIETETERDRERNKVKLRNKQTIQNNNNLPDMEGAKRIGFCTFKCRNSTSRNFSCVRKKLILIKIGFRQKTRNTKMYL